MLTLDYEITASVSRNTFGILLLAVYDLYFAQQFIDSSADCIIVNALSCEYVTDLPFLKLTVIVVSLPTSDWRKTKRFEVNVLFDMI